jgi:hypothetical protein
MDTNNYLEYSKLGGLTSDQILQSPFVFIQHYTEIESIENIIQRGGLEHRLLLGKSGIKARTGSAGAYEFSKVEDSAKNQRQFPGTYFYLKSQRDLLNLTTINHLDNPLELYENQISMIFSLALLQQKNWHLNIKDNYGVISNTTFSPQTLGKYLYLLPTLYGDKECDQGVCNEELIFHDKVSLKFCEGLMVFNLDTEQKLKNILRKYNLNIPVYVSSDDFLKSMVNVQFVNFLDDYSELDPSYPNYCYTNSKGETPYGYEGVDEDMDDMDESLEYRYIESFDLINPYTLKRVITTETNDKDLQSHPEKYDINGKIFDINEENKYLWNVMLQNCGIHEKYSKKEEEKLYHKIENKMEDVYFGTMSRSNVDQYPPFKYSPEYYKK